MPTTTTPKTTDTVAERMRRQAVTMHDVAMSLHAAVREQEGRSYRATQRGDYQTSARHLAAAEAMTEWADRLIGPGWKVYAEEHAGERPPVPAEEPPGGPYCACADPDCPDPDGQYTHD
ncbi:hypothetical protein [Streptomyces sp. NPDC002580]|uniref:hypothetical protein n=1 Tax=Streptomyces sp. NPDC002580 TaxID=3364653 RepID=UPI0036A556CE